MEIWKDIPGYDGNYQVSNTGYVRSLKFDSVRILKPGFTSSQKESYSQVKLIKNGVVKTYRVHRLVFETFTGIKSNKKFVIHHKNHNSLDNNLENLELIPFRENCSKERTLKSGLPTGVFRNKQGKFWSKIYINGRVFDLGSFDSVEEAENAYKQQKQKLANAIQ